MGEAGKTKSLLDLALADPVEAIRQANEALAQSPNDAETIALLRARGLANRLLVKLDESAADLAEAMDRATAINDIQLWAGPALTMAGTMVYQGRPQEAMALLNDCIDRATGLERTEAIFQLGTTHAQSGDLVSAKACYKRALPLIRRHGRIDWESHLLGNRGVMGMHSGDYQAALSDLDRAIELQLEQGSPAQAAINMHNKAQALYMLGDLGASLELYAQAEELQDALGLPLLMHAQKSEAFLAGGMFEETLNFAQQAHDFHRNSGAPIGEILSLMPGAEAAMALGRHDLAIVLAEAVAHVKGADNFPAWTTRAELTKIEARRHAGTATRDDLDQAAAAVATAASDSVTGSRALLIAAQIALDLNDSARAEELLESAKQLVNRCPLHIQLERWKLVAAQRSAKGNRAGALRAVTAGLRSFDRLVAGVTAYDVRVKATRHAEHLAHVGVRELLAANRLVDVVTLVERLRAGSMQLGLSTDADTAQASSVQSLIAAETRLRRGEADASSEILRLQRQIGTSAETAGPTEAQLFPGEARLTFVDLDGETVCIASTAETHTVHHCGPTDRLDQLVESQAFSHRQLARRARLSATAKAAMTNDAAQADQALADALLRDDLPQRVLINPSPSVRGVVWGALPALFERAHVVAAATNQARRTLPEHTRNAVILGSIELAHAMAEATSVANAYRVEPHIDPSAKQVTQLDGADVLHAAGHFVNHGENPLFSELPFGQESLTGASYLRLRRPPSIAVLSGCTTGQTESIAGAPFGFATAALAAGTACVIVSQGLVEDGPAVVATMAKVHEAIADGTVPAEALLLARHASPVEDRSVAAAFVAMGTGW